MGYLPAGELAGCWRRGESCMGPVVQPWVAGRRRKTTAAPVPTAALLPPACGRSYDAFLAEPERLAAVRAMMSTEGLTPEQRHVLSIFEKTFQVGGWLGGGTRSG